MNIYKKGAAIVICLMAIASIIFGTEYRNEQTKREIYEHISIVNNELNNKIQKEINDMNEKIEKEERKHEKQIDAPEDQEENIEYEIDPVNYSICPNEEYVLDAAIGKIINCNGFTETYYNMDMTGVVNRAKERGIDYSYWVRDDGVKMYGNYVIVATDWDIVPYGETVHTSLGEGISLDTGSFKEQNSYQIDVAVSWGRQAN